MFLAAVNSLCGVCALIQYTVWCIMGLMNTTAKQRLRSFLNSLTTSQRSAFAKRCGASVGHLRNMAYQDKNPSGALAVAIDRESGGAVSFTEMCPDIDWKHVEAVINRRNRRVRASLPEN